MKEIIASLLLLLVLPAFAMEAPEIMALVAKPHDDSKIIPQLKTFYLGREFEIVARSGKPGEMLTVHKPVIAKDKIVDGKYHVTEFQPENTPSPIYSVVSYDNAATVYRQWTLFPSGKVFEAIGVAHTNSRWMTWTSFETPYGENTQSISIGVHTDIGGTWREIIRQGSKVIFINEGEFKKTDNG